MSLPVNAAEIRNILNLEYNKKAVGYASILIVVISAAFSAILGIKVLAIFPALVLIWAVYKSQMNMLWIFLIINPFLMYYAVTLGNALEYLFAIIFVLLWLGNSILSRFSRFVISKEITWLMISLLFIALISILPGGIIQKEIFAYIRILILFAFITAFYDLMSPKDIIKFFIVISIPLVLNGLEIFRVFFSSKSLIDFLVLMRMKVAGMFLNANSAGFMFMLGAPYWIALVLWHKKSAMRIRSAIITFIMLAGLTLTNARASIVGIIVSLFFFALWKKRLRYYFGAILLSIVIIFSFPSIQDLFIAAARVDRGLTSRDVVWRNTIDIIKKNFVFGVGLGNFSNSYSPYLISAWEKGFIKFIPHAHNYILSKTADMGTAGLIWVIFMYIWPVKTGYYLLKRVRSTNDKMIIYAILATIFAIYAQSLFETGGLLGEARFTPDVYYWILFAALLKAKASYDQNEKEIFA